MHYIFLEGIGIYLFFILVFWLFLSALGCLIFAIRTDKRNFELLNLLIYKNEIIKKLSKENFILKLKHDELEVDD